MKRFDFLASVAVALGMGKLFPSLLRPQTEIFVLEWEAEGPDVGQMTVSMDYWDGDHWVPAGAAPAAKKSFVAVVPKGFNGDFRTRYTMPEPKVLTPR